MTTYQNEDLVTLSEAAKELGLSKPAVRQAWLRWQSGYSARPFPEPEVWGRTTRLWSLEAIKTWARRNGVL